MLLVVYQASDPCFICLQKNNFALKLTEMSRKCIWLLQYQNQKEQLQPERNASHFCRFMNRQVVIWTYDIVQSGRML